MNIDMQKDISEYMPAILDGFAYHWFEVMDRGDKAFKWKHFEKVFRKKFIPWEYIQQVIDRYLAIKQDGCSVAEYIVDKEDLENTLEDQISQPIKETSFQRGLNGW